MLKLQKTHSFTKLISINPIFFLDFLLALGIYFVKAIFFFLNEIVNRLVHPADVAPTLAAFLGMTAPASASGTVLPEALDAAR